MSLDDDLVSVPCRISKGIFSTERMVCVQLPGDREYVGLVPRVYCWTTNLESLPFNRPTEDETIDGLVGAQILRRHNGEVLVQFPDGDVAVMKTDQLHPYPHPEPACNVPVGS